MVVDRRNLVASVVAAVFFSACSIATVLAQGAAPPAPIELNSGWQLQDSAKVPEAGAILSQSSYQPHEWLAATVPGTVLTSMVNDGVYPEPLYDENNRPNLIPESLNKTSYWYRAVFTVPQDY